MGAFELIASLDIEKDYKTSLGPKEEKFQRFQREEKLASLCELVRSVETATIGRWLDEVMEFFLPEFQNFGLCVLQISFVISTIAIASHFIIFML